MISINRDVATNFHDQGPSLVEVLYLYKSIIVEVVSYIHIAVLGNNDIQPIGIKIIVAG